MSINFGYHPKNFMPVVLPIVQTSEQELRDVPERFRGVASDRYMSDRELGYDSFARAALETMRESYNPMPTSEYREFGRFFSGPNYRHLREEVKRMSGDYADDGDLMDMMIRAFTMIRPRSDIMDLERRQNFSDETTDSYVKEMNGYVLDNLPYEVYQANKQWEFMAKNRNGPSELADHPGIDTRSRNVGSLYPFDYWMPDD